MDSALQASCQATVWVCFKEHVLVVSTAVSKLVVQCQSINQNIPVTAVLSARIAMATRISTRLLHALPVMMTRISR